MKASAASATSSPDAGTAAASADIDALELSATAKKAAQELRKKHPGVVFTSGRRNAHDQAHAMASNIVSSNDRKWISNTYVAGKKLQDWVDANPDKKTVDELTSGLEATLTGMSDTEQSGISKHLSGDAFDVQPVTKDADAIKADIKALPGLSKFLESEGGLVRWHAQF
jgi:predicted Ser/Thr protein kinase